METRFSRTTLAVSTLVYPDCALTMVNVVTPAATRTAPEIINILLSFMGRTVSSALVYIIRGRPRWGSGFNVRGLTFGWPYEEPRRGVCRNLGYFQRRTLLPDLARAYA